MGAHSHVSAKQHKQKKKKKQHGEGEADRETSSSRTAASETWISTADIIKGSPEFEEYYRRQQIVPEAEWDAFMESMRSDLPISFRVLTCTPHQHYIREEIARTQASLKGESLSAGKRCNQQERSSTVFAAPFTKTGHANSCGSVAPDPLTTRSSAGVVTVTASTDADCSSTATCTDSQSNITTETPTAVDCVSDVGSPAAEESTRAGGCGDSLSVATQMSSCATAVRGGATFAAARKEHTTVTQTEGSVKAFMVGNEAEEKGEDGRGVHLGGAVAFDRNDAGCVTAQTSPQCQNKAEESTSNSSSEQQSDTRMDMGMSRAQHESECPNMKSPTIPQRFNAAETSPKEAAVVERCDRVSTTDHDSACAPGRAIQKGESVVVASPYATASRENEDYAALTALSSDSSSSMATQATRVHQSACPGDTAVDASAAAAAIPIVATGSASAATGRSASATCEGDAQSEEVPHHLANCFTALSWYLQGTEAYQIEVSRATLRSCRLLSGFHRFLVSQSEAGTIVRQEVVSMVPVLFFDIKADSYVLDLCAAPGSKTSQLLERMHTAHQQQQKKKSVSLCCDMHSEQQRYSASDLSLPCSSGVSATTTSIDDIIPPGMVVANDADAGRAHMLIHRLTHLHSPCLLVVSHSAEYFPSLFLPPLRDGGASAADDELVGFNEKEKTDANSTPPSSTTLTHYCGRNDGIPLTEAQEEVSARTQNAHQAADIDYITVAEATHMTAAVPPPPPPALPHVGQQKPAGTVDMTAIQAHNASSEATQYAREEATSSPVGEASKHKFCGDLVATEEAPAIVGAEGRTALRAVGDRFASHGVPASVIKSGEAVLGDPGSAMANSNFANIQMNAAICGRHVDESLRDFSLLPETSISGRNSSEGHNNNITSDCQFHSHCLLDLQRDGCSSPPDSGGSDYSVCENTAAQRHERIRLGDAYGRSGLLHCQDEKKRESRTDAPSGVPEHCSSISRSTSFKGLEPLLYDCVLCDVPCTADGTLRKSPMLWTKWHPSHGLSMHRLQLRILLRGIKLCRVGGRVVYSTCSLNPVENEAVVAAALVKMKGAVQLVDCSSYFPSLDRRSGLPSWQVKAQGKWYSNFEDVPESVRRRLNLRSTAFPPCQDGTRRAHMDGDATAVGDSKSSSRTPYGDRGCCTAACHFCTTGAAQDDSESDSVGGTSCTDNAPTGTQGRRTGSLGCCNGKATSWDSSVCECEFGRAALPVTEKSRSCCEVSSGTCLCMGTVPSHVRSPAGTRQAGSSGGGGTSSKSSSTSSTNSSSFSSTSTSTISRSSSTSSNGSTSCINSNNRCSSIRNSNGKGGCSNAGCLRDDSISDGAEDFSVENIRTTFSGTGKRMSGLIFHEDPTNMGAKERMGLATLHCNCRRECKDSHTGKEGLFSDSGDACNGCNADYQASTMTFFTRTPNDKREMLKAFTGDTLTAEGPAARAFPLPLHHCMRFLPHLNNTGGFFVAVLHKIREGPPHVRQSQDDMEAAAVLAGREDEEGEAKELTEDDGRQRETPYTCCCPHAMYIAKNDAECATLVNDETYLSAQEKKDLAAARKESISPTGTFEVQPPRAGRQLVGYSAGMLTHPSISMLALRFQTLNTVWSTFMGKQRKGQRICKNFLWGDTEGKQAANSQFWIAEVSSEELRAQMYGRWYACVCPAGSVLALPGVFYKKETQVQNVHLPSPECKSACYTKLPMQVQLDFVGLGWNDSHVRLQHKQHLQKLAQGIAQQKERWRRSSELRSVALLQGHARWDAEYGQRGTSVEAQYVEGRKTPNSAAEEEARRKLYMKPQKIATGRAGLPAYYKMDPSCLIGQQQAAGVGENSLSRQSQECKAVSCTAFRLKRCTAAPTPVHSCGHIPQKRLDAAWRGACDALDLRSAVNVLETLDAACAPAKVAAEKLHMTRRLIERLRGIIYVRKVDVKPPTQGGVRGVGTANTFGLTSAGQASVATSSEISLCEQHKNSRDEILEISQEAVRPDLKEGSIKLQDICASNQHGDDRKQCNGGATGTNCHKHLANPEPLLRVVCLVSSGVDRALRGVGYSRYKIISAGCVTFQCRGSQVYRVGYGGAQWVVPIALHIHHARQHIELLHRQQHERMTPTGGSVSVQARDKYNKSSADSMLVEVRSSGKDRLQVQTQQQRHIDGNLRRFHVLVHVDPEVVKIMLSAQSSTTRVRWTDLERVPGAKALREHAAEGPIILITEGGKETTIIAPAWKGRTQLELMIDKHTRAALLRLLVENAVETPQDMYYLQTAAASSIEAQLRVAAAVDPNNNVRISSVQPLQHTEDGNPKTNNFAISTSRSVAPTPEETPPQQWTKQSSLEDQSEVVVEVSSILTNFAMSTSRSVALTQDETPPQK